MPCSPTCKEEAPKLPNHQNDPSALVGELRRRLDLTQEQFAHKVGVTYSTVNHWENRKRLPQPFLLRCLLEMKEELDGEPSAKEKAT